MPSNKSASIGSGSNALTHKEDIIASILGFLEWRDVMKARSVCKVWQETIASRVVVDEIFVNKKTLATHLPSIARAMSLIERLVFDQVSLYKSEEFRVDDEMFASFADEVRQLKELTMVRTSLRDCGAQILQLRHLQSLDVSLNWALRLDLADVASCLPNLCHLDCCQCFQLTGKLSDLLPLTKSLTYCNLACCENVTGELLDLSKLEVLEVIKLQQTKVSGDIRQIQQDDFLGLVKMEIGEGIYGGGNLNAIADAPSVMQARHEMNERFPECFTMSRLRLHEDSLERYELGPGQHHSYEPPFWVELVSCGIRKGWRWTNCVTNGGCDIHWLSPEPHPDEPGYAFYLEQLQRHMRDDRLYAGFEVPPTQEEHQRRISERPLPMYMTFHHVM